MRNSLILLYLLLGCLPSGLTQQLIRGPYLTSASPTSIVITWRTDLPSNSLVMTGPAPGVFSGGFINNNPVTEHVIKLSGLSPSTTYYYSIGTTGTTLQSGSANYFRTNPVASPNYDQTIRIMAVGDVAKATVYEERVRDAMIDYLDTNRLDGYLMLGDNAYPSGYDHQFQNGFFNYFQGTLTKNTVLWPALGNHEYANDPVLRKTHQIDYFKVFTLPVLGECGGVASQTERYYSFDIGNIHFINLDSYGMEEIGGNYYGISDTLLSPQIQWLKQDLQANQLPWVIVSFHHPPYCMGTHNSDLESDLILIRQNLNPILERFNVDLVLNGHCHTYQRSNLIHQHYGHEASYDSMAHRRQVSSGMNDSSAFSCPFIKNSIPPLPSDSGLLYVVVGSGSDYPQGSQPTWPHDAMYYSNNSDHGALLLTVRGNQLKGEWVSTDSSQTVKDHFYIYKHVNRKHYLTISSGQPYLLSASWDRAGDYIWSNGDSTKTVTIQVNTAQVLTVRDKKGCIADSFFVQIGGPTEVISTEENKISLTPNPADGQLTIYGLKKGTYRLAIFYPDGRKANEEVLSPGQDKEKVIVPTAHLPVGQYFVQIHEGGHLLLSESIYISH